MLLKDKKSRLGKGLGALIPEYVEVVGKDSDYQQLAMSQIVPNPNQPRVYFDEEKLTELAESIKSHGVTQPILVRQLTQGKYEIVAGERRWRACIQLGLDSIPAVVKDLTDDDSMQIALIENIQREDINPVEEARAYSQLMKKFGYTQEEISVKLGKSRSAVANTVRLLDLADEILEELVQGSISAGHARALLSLPTNEQRLDCLKKIMQDGMNVRQVEGYVKKILSGTIPEMPMKIAALDGQQQLIRTNFWQKFTMTGTAKKGKMTFAYSTSEEYAVLLKKLGISVQ